MAARQGHSDILKLLIKRGGDVNQLKEGGGSPLMAASVHGQVECVKILLAADANAQHKSNDGHTALDYAIYHKKHTAVIAVLQAHLAQLDAKAEGEGEEEGR
jgi:ankyrin repeat protein